MRLNQTDRESSLISSAQVLLSLDQNEEQLFILILLRAILRGYLTEVEIYVCGAAVEARITSNSDTALHVAVGTGTADHIMEFLLARKSDNRVKLRNDDGNTVLAVAAIVGNVEAAKMIMKRLPELIDEKNNNNYVPLIEAARHGHKTMVNYLLPFSERHLLSQDRTMDKTRVFSVHLLISAGFYGEIIFPCCRNV